TSGPVIPRTVAFVASGTNAGVRTSPWAVRRTPVRARPSLSRASIWRAVTAGHRMLGAVLASIIDVAANIGLPIMFLLIMFESSGIPLPGETALFAAAIVSSKGKYPIEVVIGLAARAAIIGDNIGFAIGRHFGRRLMTA